MSQDELDLEVLVAARRQNHGQATADPRKREGVCNVRQI